MSLNGFVVDFCCPDAKLVVEIDGGQHADRVQEDTDRTRDLEASGYLVLRFWNNDVMHNLEGVLEVILSTLNQPSPAPLTPPLSPLGRGSRPHPRLAHALNRNDRDMP